MSLLDSICAQRTGFLYLLLFRITKSKLEEVIWVYCVLENAALTFVNTAGDFPGHTRSQQQENLWSDQGRGQEISGESIQEAGD